MKKDQAPTIDRPTPERLARAGDDAETVVTAILNPSNNVIDEKTTIRMLDGSVLDMLLSRRAITTDWYSSGARLYRDWYQAGFAHSGVVDPSKEHVDGGNSDLMADKALDAAGRFAIVMRAMVEPHRNVLINVVLLEHTLEEYGFARYGQKDKKRARLASTTSLIDALTALDYLYYGKRDATTKAGHEPDYRPAIANKDP